jgi:hypothetical protein
MAKKSIGMVLALEYSYNKKKESKKKTLKQLRIPLSFPYLIEQPKVQLFQLHQIGQDSPVYGRFYMAPIVASLNLLH